MKQNLILFAFSLGVFSPNYFPSLPSLTLVSLGCVSLVLLFCCVKRAWIISFALGLAWGAYQASLLSGQLLAVSMDSDIFLANAKIVEIKKEASWKRPQRLELALDELSHLGMVLEEHPKKVMVSWYGRETLAEGDVINAELKLRRPRGLNNPGLFDYQKWLVANRIGATGYVREILHRQPAPSKTMMPSLKSWRDGIGSQIQDSSKLGYPGIHRALVLGDSSGLSEDTWEQLRATGTVHLMVISGLHVGLVAAMGYFIFFNLGRLLSPLLGTNAVRFAIVGACTSAFIYALTSGFGLPSQRALLMLLGILVPKYFFFRTSRWFGLSLSLALIAIFEPNAVLQTGFWLSFGAVVILFLGFGSPGKPNYIFGLIRTQVLFVTGFFGVLLWQGIDLPTASFLANLAVVPIVSLLLVPLEVVALIVTLFSESLSLKIWQACDYLVQLTLGILTAVQTLNLPEIVRPAGWSIAQGIAATSAFLIWVVPGWKLRLALFIGCLPLIFPAKAEDYLLRVSVFDVGQGQAILVQQPGYNLLYDTGPKFSDSFDAGADIIVPALQQMRVARLDRMVVSHPDSDHRGGVEGVLSSIGVEQLDVGKAFNFTEELKTSRHADQVLCEMGKSWAVGNVRYTYIWPDEQRLSDNDSSCVLTISVGDLTMVLPGDISSRIENQLVSTLGQQSVDLLMVPHHGSNTSSSAGFLEKLKPAIAIVSAGYKNQFNHPHPDVVKRYEDVGSYILNTASEGAIQITWHTQNKLPEVKKASDSKIFWWQK